MSKSLYLNNFKTGIDSSFVNQPLEDIKSYNLSVGYRRNKKNSSPSGKEKNTIYSLTPNRSNKIPINLKNININIQNPYRMVEIDCKTGKERIILTNFPSIK